MQRKERIPLHDHSDGNSGGRIGSSGLQSAVVSTTTTTTTSGGAANLSELGDVNVITTPPADNDALTYDSASGKWVPSAATVASLDDVGDVNAPTPSDGDVLTWDSTPGEWVAAAPTGGSGAVATDAIWDAAGDLAVGTGANTAAKLAIGANGYVLTSNGTTAGWAAASGGSDYVYTVSGAGAISIPGLAVSSRLPASPHASDDEFDTTDTSDPMTGWTTLGSPATLNMNSDTKSHLHIGHTATGTMQVHGIYKAIPTMPFTVTIPLTDHTIMANFAAVGPFVMETGPAKIMPYWKAYVSGNITFSRQLWASRTSRTSISDVDLGVRGWHYRWMRMIVTSSTDVVCQASIDGKDWYTTHTTTNPGFTIAYVGIGITGNDNSVAAFLTTDHIRFT